MFIFFCTELANVISFVATKDKFETLHLPDLINDIPHLFTVLLISLITIKEIFNLQHYMIIATPSGGIKGRGAWGHCPLSRRPCPHLLPPSPPQKKMAKIKYFWQVYGFLPPSKSHFVPSMPPPRGKKNLVPPLATPSGGLIKS